MAYFGIDSWRRLCFTNFFFSSSSQNYATATSRLAVHNLSVFSFASLCPICLFLRFFTSINWYKLQDFYTTCFNSNTIKPLRKSACMVKKHTYQKHIMIYHFSLLLWCVKSILPVITTYFTTFFATRYSKVWVLEKNSWFICK